MNASGEGETTDDTDGTDGEGETTNKREWTRMGNHRETRQANLNTEKRKPSRGFEFPPRPGFRFDIRISDFIRRF
jgi:hypothetical protein